MIPTNLILTASLAFLVSGQPKAGGNLSDKEKPVKTNSGVNINLRIGSDQKTKIVEINDPKSKNNSSELLKNMQPEDSITEKTIELEDWMKYPKEWNNNNKF